MSLKRCVVCIAGDISEDMFAPMSWIEKGGGLDRKKIESWFEGKAAKIVWEKMDKSVTHLVISRLAFRSMHDAVRFVSKDRRVKKRAKIVTYDWLEDSLEDNKAIQDVSAYDPGKPRDIPAILYARRKESRIEGAPKTEDNSAPELGDTVEAAKKVRSEDKESPKARRELKDRTQPASLTPSNSTPSTSKQLEPVQDRNKTSSKTTTKSSPSESRAPGSIPSRAILPKPLAVRPHLPHTPGNQVAVQRPVAVESVKQDPLVAWKKTAKPKIHSDKVDGFFYAIQLKHKNYKENGEFWCLKIWESTSDALNKSFMFCANRYAEKSRVPSVTEDRNPVSSSQAALKYFAEAFRKRMSYDWDERLLRAGGEQPSNWRYELRADGKTGKTPPEYTPGDAKCKKLQDLAPIYRDKRAQHVGQRSVMRPLAPASRHAQGSSTDRPALKQAIVWAPMSSGQPRKTGGLGAAAYPSKARRSGATFASSKRKAVEAPAGPGRYAKVTKVTTSGNSRKFKSTEFVNDSDYSDDSDETSPYPQRKARP